MSNEYTSNWPIQVNTLESIPRRYADSFMKATGQSDLTGMYAVYAPLMEFLWLRKGGQFICIDGSAMHFFAPRGGGTVHTRVYKEDLNYIRYRICLLSSELEYGIQSGEGAKSLKTEFNTVRDYLYEPVQAFFRGSKREGNAAYEECGQKFIYLVKPNFKLMNASMRAYDRGHGSIANFYQPAIRIKAFLFKKKITDGLLFILTEDEFIVMEDIEHGTEYHYIRRDAILRAEIATDKDFSYLVIHLQGSSLKFPCSADNAGGILELVQTPRI